MNVHVILLFFIGLLISQNVDCGLAYNAFNDPLAIHFGALVKEKCTRMRRFCSPRHPTYGPFHTMCHRFKKECNDSEISYLEYVDVARKQYQQFNYQQ